MERNLRRLQVAALVSAGIWLFGCKDQGPTSPENPGATTGPIEGLSAEILGPNSVRIQWIAPSDQDGGRVATYEMRYVKDPDSGLNDIAWADWIPVSQLPEPRDPGTTQFVTINGLEAEASYRFAISYQNRSGSWSSASPLTVNVVLDDVPTDLFFVASVDGREYRWELGNLSGYVGAAYYDEKLYIDCILYDDTVPAPHFDESIGFGLSNGYSGAGSYSVGEGTNFGQYCLDECDLLLRASNGYFRIDEYGQNDAAITGTFAFEFTMPDGGSISITDGRFRVMNPFRSPGVR